MAAIALNEKLSLTYALNEDTPVPYWRAELNAARKWSWIYRLSKPHYAISERLLHSKFLIYTLVI